MHILYIEVINYVYNYNNFLNIIIMILLIRPIYIP